MSENGIKVCPVSCKIEHHAMMFAFLAKHAIELCGEAGKDAILAGMTTYGNERGARMAANALAHGDELTTMTNQAYGEWKPDYAGQMDFGTLRTEPTLQTYIAKCAWCEAWKKHNITEYGKYYCVNVDNAVYQGFRSDFVCTPTATSMSWGGKRCEFDWGHPLSQEEVKELAEKYGQEVLTMVGFLDGINDSLKIPNPIETMDENTKVSLCFDKELLYKNMVDARADWLYELPQWDAIFTPEKRKELYLEQKKSGTVVKAKKIGRNDPCPCGSGKKYKYCCGKNA